MNNLWNAARNAAMGAIPASVSPGNQYAKSYAAVLTLAVSADFDFDVNEFNAASAYMEQDTTLTAEKLTIRCLDFFKSYTKTIESVMCAESLDFPAVQTEMIAEVREVPEAYKPALRAMIADLIARSDNLEAAVLARINL